jgi:hypothetical protein
VLAAAIGLRPRAAASLTTISRQLIGFAFACAVVWKLLLSPDFIDGRFSGDAAHGSAPRTGRAAIGG